MAWPIADRRMIGRAGAGAVPWQAVVGYADHCRNLFPSLELDVGDLYLLEWHQIAGLPERAPASALAQVLHAHPALHQFFAARYPPIVEFLDDLLAVHGPVAADALDAAEQLVVWEIAEWIVYQREPDLYDAMSTHDWDVVAATADVVSLDDKVVLDAGAGSGHAAIAACGPAATVFALEPVATLRRYMRDKAARMGIENLFVIDGFLHAVPLPAASVDVLFTCRAIGWHLPAELREIDRVIKPGGTAIHLAGMQYPADPNEPLHQALLADGYQQGSYTEGTSTQRKYWKRRDA